MTNSRKTTLWPVIIDVRARYRPAGRRLRNTALECSVPQFSSYSENAIGCLECSDRQCLLDTTLIDTLWSRMVHWLSSSITVGLQARPCHCHFCVIKYLFNDAFSSPWSVIAQSVQRLATDVTVQGLNPGGGEIFQWTMGVYEHGALLV